MVSDMSDEKILLIDEKHVAGNLERHVQSYSIALLPKNLALPEKIVVNIKTDIFNSLRFSSEVEFWEFIEDLFLSYFKFIELKRKPDYISQFRLANLEEKIDKLKTACLNQWKGMK